MVLPGCLATLVGGGLVLLRCRATRVGVYAVLPPNAFW